MWIGDTFPKDMRVWYDCVWTLPGTPGVARAVLEAREDRHRHRHRWETGQEVCAYLMHI